MPIKIPCGTHPVGERVSQKNLTPGSGKDPGFGLARKGSQNILEDPEVQKDSGD